MKRMLARFSILFFLSFVCFTLVHAQAGKLPPFRMMQADGKIFKAENLPMGKPILLIYFSPECEHCEKMLIEFFKHPADFKKASVAFITFLPLAKLAKFNQDYHLEKYGNCISGTEGNSYFIRNYYRVKDLPFVALYTKNGDFVASYEKEISLKDLAAKLNHLP